MNTLVTILARANSKGFSGKNLKIFFGKPLYQYTVDQAISWGRGEIACSTDSEEIIQGLPIGVEAIRRPFDLCEDDTPKIKAIRHATQFMEVKKNLAYDLVIDLDVTNPIRTTHDIEDAFQLFLEKKPPVLFSVTKARKSPYFNQVEFDKEGKIKTPKQTKTIYRRQDTPLVYDINCSIYIYNRNWLIQEENNSVIVGNACVYLMQDWQAFDVDNEVDWEILKAMRYKYM